MDKTIFPAGSTQAVRYAADFFEGTRLRLSRDISQADYILLDIPTFNASGQLRDGRSLGEITKNVRNDSVMIGGNLIHPDLEGFATLDLLQDAGYLAQNAYITAECALDVALPYLTVTLRNCPVLILGWGRIGKCLARLLKALDADVTVAARKEADRAMLSAMGYGIWDYSGKESISNYRLIFNTVPKTVLNREQMAACHPDCVKIDLASSPGMEDEDVIIARGLPGLHFPESTGRLIAQTILRKENLM